MSNDAPAIPAEGFIPAAAQTEERTPAATPAAGLSKLELASIITTVVLLFILAILAWASANYDWRITLAFSVGGLGGLIHEIAQSGGKILFFKKQEDGFYLGSVAGIVLGAAAGLLAIKGFLIGGTTPLPSTNTQIIYEVFLAGLALKGVTEAAAGTAVPAKNE